MTQIPDFGVSYQEMLEIEACLARVKSGLQAGMRNITTKNEDKQRKIDRDIKQIRQAEAVIRQVTALVYKQHVANLELEPEVEDNDED